MKPLQYQPALDLMEARHFRFLETQLATYAVCHDHIPMCWQERDILHRYSSLKALDVLGIVAKGRSFVGRCALPAPSPSLLWCSPLSNTSQEPQRWGVGGRGGALRVL